MTANDTKSYLGYLNKLVNEYNNSYVLLVKKLLMLIILLWLKKMNGKVPKLVIESDKKYKNNFSKGCTENWSRKISVTDSDWKTNPGTYEIKDLNGEKIIKTFMKKNCC